MKHHRPTSLFLAVLLLLAASGSLAATPTTLPALFDPARHMRVSEVRTGMRGYGLTVFQGTRIERFDVEVLSILRNFNPKFDVVLIQCHNAFLEHSGSIAGMSGSPIYLRDDSGHERMIGAFAYGWPLMKDPIAGVQPIEYMLHGAEEKPVADGSGTASQSIENNAGKMSWSLKEAVTEISYASAGPMREWSTFVTTRAAATKLDTDRYGASKLHPLATPMMTSGIGSRSLESISPIFRSAGLVPLQAGSSGTVATTNATDLDAPLAPGSALVVPMMTGDSELSAVGTCTEVIGDHFFGFGHSFNSEGAISLPVGSGQIASVIAKLDQSFKLGALTKLRGTLTSDRVYGVGGVSGASPQMIPFDMHVVRTDGSPDEDFHANLAKHEKLTPMIAGTALTSAITGARDLPANNTVDYSLEMEFSNGRSIRIADRAANANPIALFMELSLPISAAGENPYERVSVKRISGTVRIDPVAKEAEVLYVNVPKLKYRPGETVSAYIAYRPFRAAEATMPISIELPRDLPDGPYSLAISDSQRYLADEASTEPFRFTAENAGEIFDVLNDFTSIRRDALYARIVRQSDGVAVGRVAMPRLPSSRRQVLLGSGRSNTTPFVSSTVKIIPTEYVMTGAADFQIEIDSGARVEVGGGAVHAPKPEAAPKFEEPKPGKTPIKPPATPTPSPEPSNPPSNSPEPAKPGQ